MHSWIATQGPNHLFMDLMSYVPIVCDEVKLNYVAKVDPVNENGAHVLSCVHLQLQFSPSIPLSEIWSVLGEYMDLHINIDLQRERGRIGQ